MSRDFCQICHFLLTSHLFLYFSQLRYFRRARDRRWAVKRFHLGLSTPRVHKNDRELPGTAPLQWFERVARRSPSGLSGRDQPSFPGWVCLPRFSFPLYESRGLFCPMLSARSKAGDPREGTSSFDRPELS